MATLVLHFQNYLTQASTCYRDSGVAADRRETLFAGRKICSRIKLSSRGDGDSATSLSCAQRRQKIEDTVPHRNLKNIALGGGVVSFAARCECIDTFENGSTRAGPLLFLLLATRALGLALLVFCWIKTTRGLLFCGSVRDQGQQTNKEVVKECVGEGTQLHGNEIEKAMFVCWQSEREAIYMVSWLEIVLIAPKKK